MIAAGTVDSRDRAGIEPDDVAEVIDVDRVARRHDEQPLDGIAQLAHVPLPARLLKELERRRRESLRPPVVLAAEQIGEVADERWDVFTAIAQRRHADGNDAQAK